MNIILNHICCNSKALPQDFFSTSIFGKSLILEHERASIQTPSDLKPQNFKRLGFPSSFCTILEFGLPLLLGANPPRRLVPNHPSANLEENREFLKTTLAKWESMNILSYVEEQPHIVNPFSIVSNSKKRRLVLDARSSGLNDHIISPKFHLPNMEEIVQSLHANDFMMKLDLANGFLQLPICVNERMYLGFKSPIDGRFGVLNRLSFGLRSAPFLFATFTYAIKEALLQTLKIKTEVYIDDWFIANHSLDRLQSDRKSFTNFLSELGVAIQHEKTEGPARCITYLGLTIDTVNCRIQLPETKRLKYLQGLEDLLHMENPTMAQLAKTAGRLVHISSVHRAGSAHIQPLWDILYKDRKQWTRAQLEREGLTIDSELIECLNWWKETLLVPDMSRKVWVSSGDELFLWSCGSARSTAKHAQTICSDASNIGWGACTGSYTSTGIWSNRQKRNSINWRELKAVNLAINSWQFIRDSPVLILSDSSTVVAAVRKRASHTIPLQNLIFELTEIEDHRNIEVVALHIPGALNDLPDRLSRGLDVRSASMLTFDKKTAPAWFDEIKHFYGLTWNDYTTIGTTFTREQFLSVAPQTSLIAVTTPDLPFLNRQLSSLANHKAVIYLLIPEIVTSENNLISTQIIEENSKIRCLNAINIEWKILKVIQNGGIPARIATKD